MITLFLLSAAIIGAIMLAMVLGQMASKRCLRGSCGGLDTLDAAAGDDARCDACPMRPSRTSRTPDPPPTDTSTADTGRRLPLA